MATNALPTLADGAAGGARGGTEEDEDAVPEELLREAENAFGELFSVHPPRDAFAGLWSGVSCILSGVLLGVVGVIVQPVQGARTAGVLGCFRGIAIGLCSGFFFSLTGLCTGMFQAVRGVVATPRAICMAGQGYRWDKAKFCWEAPLKYSLPDEASRVFANGMDAVDESEEEDAAEGAPSRKRVADTYLYDQLGVQPNATQREIRRAYFQQSRRWHPDKAQEPNAKEKFQAISEAYQVLSEPPRRREYDAKGRSGEQDVDFVDAKVFFSVLLGADALEPFLGRLRIADLFGDNLFGLGVGEGDEDLPASVAGELRKQRRDRSDARQTRREVRLAVSLVDRLSLFVNGDVGAFMEQARADVKPILAKDPTLERFIAEIGWVYRHRADSFLARWESPFGVFGFRSLLLRAHGGGRQARQGVQTARLAVKSLYKLRKIVNEADSVAQTTAPGEEAEDELPTSLTSALPTFMETFFSICSHDINGTLRKVVERVLTDTSEPQGVIRRRAFALRELGEVLLQEAEQSRRKSSSVASTAAASASVATPSRPSAVTASSTARRGESADAGTPGGHADDERKRRRFEEAFIASVGGGVGSSRNAAE